MITNVFIAFGVMMIPIGFLVATTSVPKIWVWAAGAIGFVCLFWAVIRANKEDKIKENESTDRIKLMKAIATKMGVDVDKILNNK